MSVLDETKAELAAIEAEILAREKAIRAPVLAKRERVDALRAEADELTARYKALEVEGKDARVFTPFGDAEAATVARLLGATFVFVAAAVSLPEHTPQAFIGGLIVAVVALVRGLVR